MARPEATRATSSALSPVNAGASKSYMTPQCSWVLSKIKLYSVEIVASGTKCTTTLKKCVRINARAS